jgi:hypothetical protein
VQELVYRLGVVFWWFGAAWAAVAACTLVAALLQLINRWDLQRSAEASSFALLCLIPVVICWAVCYVCTGSFWQRPRHA